MSSRLAVERGSSPFDHSTQSRWRKRLQYFVSHQFRYSPSSRDFRLPILLRFPPPPFTSTNQTSFVAHSRDPLPLVQLCFCDYFRSTLWLTLSPCPRQHTKRDASEIPEVQILLFAPNHLPFPVFSTTKPPTTPKAISQRLQIH